MNWLESSTLEYWRLSTARNGRRSIYGAMSVSMALRRLSVIEQTIYIRAPEQPPKLLGQVYNLQQSIVRSKVNVKA